MRNLEFGETSLVDLVRGLPRDFKDLIRDEIDLAKTEITSPTGIKNRAIKSVRAKPYKWGLIAFGSGMVGSLLVGGKLKKAMHPRASPGRS